MRTHLRARLIPFEMPGGFPCTSARPFRWVYYSGKKFLGWPKQKVVKWVEEAVICGTAPSLDMLKQPLDPWTPDEEPCNVYVGKPNHVVVVEKLVKPAEVMSLEDKAPGET